jgi:hypothetical protein
MVLTTTGFPDAATLSLLLSACSHAGATCGIDYLECVFTKDHCRLPDAQHYGIVADFLGRCGDFRRLENVIGRWLGARDDLTLWLCVLSACKRHRGHVELAESAFEHAVELHPKQDVAYILMSNIYIDAGMLAHAAQVDDLRWKNQISTNMDGDMNRGGCLHIDW